MADLHPDVQRFDFHGPNLTTVKHECTPIFVGVRSWSAKFHNCSADLQSAVSQNFILLAGGVAAVFVITSTCRFPISDTANCKSSLHPLLTGLSTRGFP